MINDDSHLDIKIIDSLENFGNWLEENRARLNLILVQKTSSELRSKVEVEDILQDAVARAMRTVPSLNLAESEVMPWFLQVLNHAIIDLHRYHFGALKRDGGREVSAQENRYSESDQPNQLADILVTSITSPSQAFSRHLRMDRMQEALNQLPPDARNAIQWRFMDGLSSQEIAARLGKSDGATRVLIVRTLKKLEALLDDVRPTTSP